MQGLGVPIVTPFNEEREIDTEKLRSLVSQVIDAGIDFIVPCGSNGESELMTMEERTAVIRTVADQSSVPVLAGTGHPGFAETNKQTELAVEAGADAALVVTPYYYTHNQATLKAYYRKVADNSDIPIYLYSVPSKTGVKLAPKTVESLSSHKNIYGMKDSSGNLVSLIQENSLTDSDFELFIGNGSLYAQGLDAGATGGILALANVVPELTTEIHQKHRNGNQNSARNLNSDLVDLNQAVTARYGVPGVKAAMKARNLPAGENRSPFASVENEVQQELEYLVTAAIEEHHQLLNRG